VTDRNPWSQHRGPRSPDLGGTTRSRVAHELRDRIILGDLPPGARIDLDETADELGVSRTPVREACLELAHDGLVRMAPRSGITVIGIKHQDLLENFHIMTKLAGIAANWAALRMTPERLAAIAACRDEVAEAVRLDGDIADANWRFHREINLASQSPRLATLLAQTGRLIPANFFRMFPAQIMCTVGEHEELVDALAERDAARAQSVMERHFDNAREIMATHFNVASPGIDRAEQADGERVSPGRATGRIA
jgi:DNA-binding GntR family transcriptional regulator